MRQHDDHASLNERTGMVSLPDDLFIYDPSAAEPEVAALLHHLLAGDGPRATDEIARIARDTSSAGYTQLIAKQAADLVTTWALSTAQVHEIPIVMSRLADFVLLARRTMLEGA